MQLNGTVSTLRQSAELVLIRIPPTLCSRKGCGYTERLDRDFSDISGSVHGAHASVWHMILVKYLRCVNLEVTQKFHLSLISCELLHLRTHLHDYKPNICCPGMMDYKYSQLISQDNYETDGLSFDVPLRSHRDSYKEGMGALQAQKDWDEQVSPLNGYHGGLGPAFCFVRVTVPECLPERLEIISYVNEFAFLYDGKLLTHGFQQGRMLMTCQMRWRSWI
jgi:hypothetical protein